MDILEKEVNNLAPIVLFVYNRPEHTKKTICSLLDNELARYSTLYVYSDHYKTEKDRGNVLEVRNYIKSIEGFKVIKIIEREENWGLAKSVINGVTEVLNEYGKVITLEDDLVFAQNFLRYMNEGLEYYENTPRIWAIGGHSHSITMPKEYKHGYYVAIRTCSWGWATWKDRWDTIDWEVSDYDKIRKDKKLQKEFNRGGNDSFDMLKAQMNHEIDSWAVRWDYSASKQNRYTLYPINTMVASTGMDGSGVHCAPDPRFMDIEPVGVVYYEFDHNIEFNSEIARAVYNYYKKDLLHVCWSYLSNVLDAAGTKKLKKIIKKRAKRIYRNLKH